MPGGVCAVLDYEVDMMAEYVAEMATRLVTPDAAITSGFRKFVTQILTSTRLPSTTILLGMNYLAKRVNAMKTTGPYKASEGQVWRYLTVSLLLGSKFLDDNTFQNRSWSEVSGITVAELNSLEYDWVQAMNWRLYVNLDLSKDYQAWLDSWRDFQQMKKRQAAQASRDRLASLVPLIPRLPDTTAATRPTRDISVSRWPSTSATRLSRLSTTSPAMPCGLTTHGTRLSRHQTLAMVHQTMSCRRRLATHATTNGSLTPRPSMQTAILSLPSPPTASTLAARLPTLHTPTITKMLGSTAWVTVHALAVLDP